MTLKVTGCNSTSLPQFQCQDLFQSNLNASSHPQLGLYLLCQALTLVSLTSTRDCPGGLQNCSEKKKDRLKISSFLLILAADKRV